MGNLLGYNTGGGNDQVFVINYSIYNNGLLIGTNYRNSPILTIFIFSEYRDGDDCYIRINSNNISTILPNFFISNRKNTTTSRNLYV